MTMYGPNALGTQTETARDRLGRTVDRRDNPGSGNALTDQVSQQPWLMVGAAVAAGYLLGSLLGGDDGPSTRRTSQPIWTAPAHAPRPLPATLATAGYSQKAAGAAKAEDYPQAAKTSSQTSSSPSYRAGTSSTRAGLLDQQTLAPLRDELQTLRDAGLVSLRTLLRDSLQTHAPGLQRKADDMLHRRQHDQSAGDAYAQTYEPSSGAGRID